jgi:hypothetical protein
LRSCRARSARWSLRDDADIQYRRVRRQVIFLAVKLRHRRSCRQRNAEVRRRSGNPRLHQRGHIHLDELPRLTDVEDLRRGAARW